MGAEFISAIIVAAGQGLRMEGAKRKQYLDLGGMPILARTLVRFDALAMVDRLIVVVPQSDLGECRRKILHPLALSTPAELAAGGESRQESVYNGLRCLAGSTDIVVIHDGVRPFFRSKSLADCIAGAREAGACIAGIPAVDTLKRVDAAGHITETIPRSGIWQAQTPQAFRCQLIWRAHQQARETGFSGTDDARLVERMGVRIKIVAGHPDNIKITTRDDLKRAEAMLSAAPDPRVSR